jgi:hypothetical protein
VRAPGSSVTIAPPTRAGALPWKRESIRTGPVKYSAGPLWDGCEPLRAICIVSIPSRALARPPAASKPTLPAVASMHLRVIIVSLAPSMSEYTRGR